MGILALRKAIKLAGSQTKLAKAVGVEQTAVSNWLNRNKRVPAERVLLIEAATGVSRHELRPDIYPRDQAASSAQPLALSA
jgi:DNA-binding transcriptional regulator YdaS (Cro superfamily)